MRHPLRRKVLFAALYFSEGAPIGFLWWALPTKLRAAGLGVEEITGLLSVLVLPWALKFLGAPFIDVLRSPRWPLRAWIASCQLLMGLLLLITLRFDWKAEFGVVSVFLILHAVTAALQDVSVDAYAVAIVAPEHRGSINAWMQVGMLTGRALFGGGALLVASWIGDTAMMLMLVGAIWSSLAVLGVAGALEGVAGADAGASIGGRRAVFLLALGEVLRARSTWLVLGFAIIGGAGFEAVGILVGPYLLDRGFSSAQIGGFLFLPIVGALILAALAAGTLADHLERRRTVGSVLVLMVVTIAVLSQLSVTAPGWLPLGLLALLYFLIGAFTTASYALFMDQTDARLGATQLSTYMSGTNVCESGSAFAVGKLVGVAGYGTAFLVMALVSLVGLPLLWRLPARVKSA
ncbi:MAG: MFS transporter [Vicinamibacterales bacterium]